MPTIYKSRNKWRAQVRLAGQSLTKSFEKKADAASWARLQEAAIERAEHYETTTGRKPEIDDTIGTFIDAYAKSKKRRSASWAAYVRHIRTNFGGIKRKKFSRRDIIDYVMERERAGVMPSTIEHALAYLNAAISNGAAALDRVEDGAALLAVCSGARKMLRAEARLAVSRKRERRPTDAELSLIEDYCFTQLTSQIPLWDIVQFAICTCMRREEILRVMWVDFDPQERTIIVRNRKDPQSTQDNDQVIPLLTGPFTWQGNQVNPIDIMLRQRSARRREGRVFPYTPANLTKVFCKAVQELKINDLHFHDLRHDGISRLFEHGYSIPEVAKVSGHKSWEHLKRYTQIKPAALHRKASPPAKSLEVTPNLDAELPAK